MLKGSFILVKYIHTYIQEGDMKKTQLDRVARREVTLREKPVWQFGGDQSVTFPSSVCVIMCLRRLLGLLKVAPQREQQ